MSNGGTRPGVAPEAPPLAGLQRFLARSQAPKPRPGERCDMCGEPIAAEHSHVVNVHSRSLMCTCRPCYLLFMTPGAAQGRYKAVPDRYLYDPAFALSSREWDEIQIPVKMAFFFVNSELGRFGAFYPSPAGATESLLPLDVWETVMAANPRFATVEPDVEALLLNRDQDSCECFLAPIAVCYELVGRVKLHWKGFSGGEEVWGEIDAFFADLRQKSRLVETGQSNE
ncbi:MAG: DUF5947 family protein [Chloroflexota bacterium]|nr:DUF5947 family protein [Chloroflexota bacterium]